MARYGLRALSQRKFAIRDFDAACLSPAVRNMIPPFWQNELEFLNENSSHFRTRSKAAAQGRLRNGLQPGKVPRGLAGQLRSD